MFRRWAIAGVIACGGGAFAQPWPAVPAAKADADTVYVMRTAGQSDRMVKVVRAADPSDPSSLAEVMDTATKKTFVIPGKVLTKLPKAGTPRAELPAPVETPPPPAVAPVEPPPVASAPPVLTNPLPKIQLSPVTPKAAAPVEAPPNTLKPVAAETVATVPPPAVLAAPKPTELPTVASPVPTLTTPSPPTVNDPWRATGEARAFAPTPPPPVAGPRLTPVPTWRATPKPFPPGVNDPWRPTGG